MTDRVEDSDSRHRSSYNRQDLPRKVIQSRLMLFVNNIDWLDLSHKHDLLSGLIVESPTRSDGVSVILNRFFGAFGLHNYWYDLEMVEKV